MSYEIKNSNYKIDKIPDTCPACGKGIQPITHSSFGVDTWRRYEGFLQVVYICPREPCRRLFIAKYLPSEFSIGDDTLQLNRTYLLEIIDFQEFPEFIKTTSKDFSDIYNQSKIAEENGLLLIAGSGYRKALEFLIKDYLIKSNPNDKQIIENEPLGRVIKRIDDKRIEVLASRAAWLGNDETHYTRKWIDQDLKDLKNLIGMVVDLIDLIERSREYVEVMPSPEISVNT